MLGAHTAAAGKAFYVRHTTLITVKVLGTNEAQRRSVQYLASQKGDPRATIHWQGSQCILSMSATRPQVEHAGLCISAVARFRHINGIETLLHPSIP